MTKFYSLRVTLALAGAVAAQCVFGVSLSPQQALQRVQSASQTVKIKKMPAVSAFKLVETRTATDNDATPLVYVFDKGDGYLIASADDRFPALLGYGDTGTLSGTVPPALQYMVGEYAREMEYTLSQPQQAAATAAEVAPQWQAVEPLLTCKWNQDAPFNNYSPKMIVINSSTGQPTGQEFETPAGCVATAMAQVMYYHRWPAVGEGSNSYLWQTYADVKQQTLSCNFAETPLEWDKMLPYYTVDAAGNPTWSAEAGDAVAKLLYACAVSVNMHFNAAQVGGSGAYNKDLALALIKYFKYSRGMRMTQRDYTSNAAFEELIYNELKQNMPVIYDGRGAEGGHSFVCDGYSGNHYFHFNWGWGGVSDGYFYLGRLNPATLGIGGGSGGFNYTQAIVYNIRPLRDGADTAEAQEPFLRCVGNFDYSSRSGNKTTFTVKDALMGYASGLWNLSLSPFTGYIGLAVVNTKGEATFVPCVQETALQPFQGRAALTGDVDTPFGPGEYGIYPAMYNTETKKAEFIRVANGYRSYVVMTVAEDGTRTFANADRADEVAFAPQLAVSCFSYQGQVYSGAPKQFMLSLTNLSDTRDYNGDLTMVIRDDRGRERATIPVGRYDVPAGMAYPLSFSTTLNVLVKNYTVVFRDSYGRTLPGEFQLNVSGTAPTISTQLRVSALSPVEIEPNAKAPMVTFTAANYGSTELAAPSFVIKVTKTGETTPVRAWVITYSNLTIPAQTAYPLSITNVPFNLAAGDYEVQFMWRKAKADGTGTEDVVISQPMGLRAGYAVTEMTFGKSEAQLSVGTTLQLQPSFKPENATFTTLQWTSTNPEVATVDNSGVITAVAEGVAYITGSTYNAIQDVCRVTVAGMGGVDNVQVENAAIVAVYRADGVQVLTNPAPAALQTLPRGLYIVRTTAGSYKLTR